MPFGRRSPVPVASPSRMDRLTRSPFYRWPVGLVAITGTFLVAQNLDVWRMIESAPQNPTYLSMPDVCDPYIEPARDSDLIALAGALAARGESTADDRELESMLDRSRSAQDTRHVRSRASRADLSHIAIRETASQIYSSLSAPPLETFTLATSGQPVRIHSNDAPEFTVNRERFDEVFHAMFDSRLFIADPVFRAVRECMINEFDLPNATTTARGDARRPLDILVLARPGFCLAGLRYVNYADGERPDACNARGATVPRTTLRLFGRTIFDREQMILTYGSAPTPQAMATNVDGLLAHEAVHYWLDQVPGRDLQIEPEERFVTAIQEALQRQGIANLDESPGPAIEYDGYEHPSRSQS